MPDRCNYGRERRGEGVKEKGEDLPPPDFKRGCAYGFQIQIYVSVCKYENKKRRPTRSR